MGIAEALMRLVAAADDGHLDEIARRHGLALVTVFGSAVRDASTARDLDVAVLFAQRTAAAELAVLEELMDLSGTERVDLMVLDDAGPEARFNGLTGALPLWQDGPGRWGTTQMAAASEVFDTEWLRQAALERMAAG
ncbi:nucleotidyltransferase family protein [Quadrisphaera sp. KR29]|uniref:nucleotidyltransferase family protein n=1 Tax=Quadrisphaera sp. KR29 TaxID=3461391 RepID=UPI00404453B5